ncbi:MAG: endonuclease MutS2 [Thermotogota bacterium]
MYPNNFEEKTGFLRIRELIREECLSDRGASFVDQIEFSTAFETIKNALTETKEFQELINKNNAFPTSGYHDLIPALKRGGPTDSFIEIEDLIKIKESQQVVRAIKRFFDQLEDDSAFPLLRTRSENLPHFPFIEEQIQKIINPQGALKNNASPELSRLREQITEKEGQASKRINAIMKDAQSRGLVEKEASLAMRNGRTVIPIDSSSKRKIEGYVHDQSASGKTAYIEPSEIVELNNQLRELRHDEHREIIRILIKVTNDLRPYFEDLKAATNGLGEIDLIRAKALFGNKIKGSMPHLRNAPFFDWQKAFHPLLFLTLQKEQKEIVPMDLSLDEEKSILVISGPNAGGKSVCLQTTGLVQYMLQCGLLVPMSELSVAGIFSKLFLDIGDEQSIENDLSTYSSHLINMKHFLKEMDQGSLFMIDEFGAGTEPVLGGSIAESILEEFRQRKAFGIITTHYSNLKHYASQTSGIENGAMLFDPNQIKPLFQLSIGKPDSSFAFEIAKKIGLPEHILQHATEKTGQEHIEFDENLKELARDKRYWNNKRQEIRLKNKKLESTVNDLNQQLEDIQKNRKTIIKEAKEEARGLIEKANKQVENTIRQIKESQAEKKQTLQARENLETHKDRINNYESNTDKILNKKHQYIQKHQVKTENKPREQNQKADTLKVGDIVTIKDQETPGKILWIKGKKAQVQFGEMKTLVHLDQLIHSNKKHWDQQQKQKSSTTSYAGMSERQKKFTADIDVRGKRADEAIQIVQQQLDDAIFLSIPQIRILHGKGDGILRSVIRQYLDSEPIVKSVRDEDVRYGGSGISIVSLQF